MREEPRDEIIDLGNETGLSLNRNKSIQEESNLEYFPELQKMLRLKKLE